MVEDPACLCGNQEPESLARRKKQKTSKALLSVVGRSSHRDYRYSTTEPNEMLLSSIHSSANLI